MTSKAPKRIKNPAVRRDAKKGVANFFYHEQLANGHDIMLVATALLHALAHHYYGEGITCVGYWIAAILRDFAVKTEKNVQDL